MALYQKLNCPNYSIINEEILQWVESLNIIDNSNVFWNPVDLKEMYKNCPKFFKWAATENFKIKSISLTVGKNPYCCGPHTDTPPKKYSISWPIKNTRRTWNTWYRPLVDNPSVMINDIGGTAYTDRSQLEIIERKELLEPILLDVTVIHDVWCEESAQFPRLGLQCQLFNENAHL